MRSERELYVLWEENARPGSMFLCRGGERVTVISPGRRNTGAGPDYPGAVLLVDGRLRSGAVEMHLVESDWFAHRHDSDPAYGRVILHLLGSIDGDPSLALPTLDAAALEARDARAIIGEGEGEIRSRVTPALLSELSWERLLRRTTATMRQAPGTGAEALAPAFVRLLFDGLGYSNNRIGMRRVASEILERSDEHRSDSFERLAARIFAIAAVDRTELERIGREFVPEARLAAILPPEGSPISHDWRNATRPANAPARRLWGGAKLLFDVFRQNLLTRLASAVASGRGLDPVIDLLTVRLGSEVVVGRARAGEIALNAVIPVTLALGLREENIPLIEGACRAYRNAPAQSSNRHLRLFRQRFGLDLTERGAFWQQGGIELVQRYLSEDRAGLSFVAEALDEG
jgi:hypothetical protein